MSLYDFSSHDFLIRLVLLAIPVSLMLVARHAERAIPEKIPARIPAKQRARRR